ncbi:MAG: hypothetical protein K6B44_12125 [Lachnospiraceae bacterium]|nr:hypothetical protein [Lachnospiraceae bacterium]
MKKSAFIKSVFTGLAVSGMIIILVGMYYLVIKAGIPYQDPPLELQIQYTVNMNTGEELFKTGVLICGIGLIGRIVVSLTDRFRKNSYDHRSDEN